MSRVLTGIKPTGQPHLGNYLGAIKPALALREKYKESLFFVADGHALVSSQKGEIRQMSYEVAAAWPSCGLDPSKDLIYRQSDVPEIFELAWILSCFTPKGFMNRAHAYKSKVQDNQQKGTKELDEGVSMGLYFYPVLMAADILLFDANGVPVGPDQKQHLEFARDIVKKLNHVTKKQILTLPDCISHSKASVMGLDGEKMSKSYNNHVPLFCTEKKLKKLLNQVKTDSLPAEAPKPFDGTVIASLYESFATPEQVENFKSKLEGGVSWGEAKADLFELINPCIAPMRDQYNSYMENLDQVEDILIEGANKARALAKERLIEVKDLLGLSTKSN